MKQASSFSYYIISLGCSKNLVDSEKVNDALRHAGLAVSEDIDGADILIINTCGFINDAKEESIEMVLDALDGQPEKKVVVMGCLSGRYSEEIKKEIPEIDFLYGIPDDDFVRKLFGELEIVPASKKFHPLGSFSGAPLLEGQGIGYVKISDGCSNNCSYCAIPIIRGPHRSFPPGQVSADAAAAAERGVKEINIVAQDICSYHYKDTAGEEWNLPRLVKSLEEIKGLQWIRLLYCHPDNITDEVIELFGTGKVLPYADIPFQHGSEGVLKRMGRRGSSRNYLALVEKIRREVPGIHIRSTFMVGFPGETEEDFEILLDFAKKARLERVGAFVYSREEGTGAAVMEGHVPEELAVKRYNKLMELQQRISREVMESMVGKEVRVLVEEEFEPGLYGGRTVYDAPEVDGIFYLTAENVELHSIVTARITDSIEYDLLGELV